MKIKQLHNHKMFFKSGSVSDSDFRFIYSGFDNGLTRVRVMIDKQGYYTRYLLKGEPE